MSDKNEEYMNEFEGGTVTIYLDDKEVECEIIAVFPVGEKDYIALLPMDDEASEVFLYEYIEDENGEPSIEYIEDEDEYEAVADAFDELMDEDEFNQLLAEDDD